MKHISLVKIVICFFLFDQLFAQCNEYFLDYNSGYIYLDGSSSSNYNWLKIDNNLVYENGSIRITNYSQNENVQVLFFQNKDCSSVSSPIYSCILDSYEKIVPISSLPILGELFFVIYSPVENPGLYKVDYTGGYVDEGCNIIANANNSYENPVKLSSLSNPGTIAIASCNDYCSSSEMYNLKLNEPNFNTIKWYEVPNCYDGLLTVQLVQQTLVDGSILIVGEKDSDQEVLFQKYFLKDTSTFMYIPVSGFERVRIGVGSSFGSAGNFILSVERLIDKHSCVDYSGNGDVLEVIQTSKGSDLNGPFQPGEVIRFRYKLNKWVPIKNNWPHSFTLTTSPEWKIDTFPMFQDTQHWQMNTTVSNNFGENGSFLWLNSSVDMGTNISPTGSYAGKGWYYLNNIEGPRNWNPLSNWGLRFNHQGSSIDTSLVQFEFSLKLLDSLNCNSGEPIFVRIAPHSDFETGNYSLQGCSDNGYEEVKTTLSCCAPNPNKLSLVKNPICYGENIEILSKDTSVFTWNIVEYNQYGLANNSIRFPSANLLHSNKTDSLKILIKRENVNFCPDSVEFKVLIKEVPSVELGKDLVICPGTDVRIVNSKYDANNYYSYFINNNNEALSCAKEIMLHPDRDMNLKVIARNDLGCEAKDEVGILVDQISTIGINDSMNICEFNSIVTNLAIKANSKYSNIKSITFYDIKENNRQLSQYPNSVGNYILEIVNANLCKVRQPLNLNKYIIYDTIWVAVSDNKEVYDYDVFNETLAFERGSQKSPVGPCTQKEKVFVFKHQMKDMLPPLSCRPNPSQGEFNVYLSDLMECLECDIYVVDFKGQIIFKEKLKDDGNNKIVIENKGIYYVIILNNNTPIAFSRVVIE